MCLKFHPPSPVLPLRVQATARSATPWPSTISSVTSATPRFWFPSTAGACRTASTTSTTTTSTTTTRGARCPSRSSWATRESASSCDSPPPCSSSTPSTSSSTPTTPAGTISTPGGQLHTQQACGGDAAVARSEIDCRGAGWVHSLPASLGSAFGRPFLHFFFCFVSFLLSFICSCRLHVSISVCVWSLWLLYV